MIVYIFICVAVVLYFYLKWHFSYWSRSGLETYNANFFTTVVGPNIFNAYFNFKRKGLKHGGTFIFFSSYYIPADLDVVKHILQVDFDHFMNRGLLRDPPPILTHLLTMDGEEWKTWRARLTPTFTSGKMKMMFHTMIEKSSILGNIFKEQAIINEPIDIKETSTRYTTDVIGSTAFGIECNSLENPNAELRTFGKKMLDRLSYAVLVFGQLPKSFLDLFGFRYLPEDMESFFVNTIKATMNYRESNNIYRKDFMHLLLQLKNKGQLADDESVLGDNNKSGEHITLEEITAQCLLFFGAGYETSATTMSFTVLELTQHQDIQDKLRKEIRTVLNEHGGEMTYEAIMQMEYLDKVIQETLRKYSPAQFFPRLCNKDYTVPGTNHVIKKGQKIMLPYRAIHNDPEYWPEPEKFDPERFSPENKAKRHRFAFLAFGEGPRNCIGSRFGLLQTKIGIASTIKDCRLRISNKTSRPIEIDNANVIPAIKGSFLVDIEKVD